MNVRMWSALGALVLMMSMSVVRAAEPAPRPAWVQVPPSEATWPTSASASEVARLAVSRESGARFGELLEALLRLNEREPAAGTQGAGRYVWPLDDGKVLLDAQSEELTLDVVPSQGAPQGRIAAMPMLAGAGGSCAAFVRATGRPTWMGEGDFYYLFRGARGSGLLAIRCRQDVVRALRIVAPREGVEVRQESCGVNHPKGRRFEGVGYMTERGPKPLASPWPFGLANDARWDALTARWGLPGIVDDAWVWGISLAGRMDEDRLDSLVITSADHAWLLATKTSGREVGWFGRPVSQMEADLGPATIASTSERMWLYRNDLELVSVVAKTTPEARVETVVWQRWDRSTDHIGICDVNVLAPPAPRAAGPTHVFHSSKPETIAAMMRPWGIEDVRDMFRVLGPPTACGPSFQYPGITVSFDAGGLRYLSIAPEARELLTARGLSTELLDALSGGASSDAYLGSTAAHYLPPVATKGPVTLRVLSMGPGGALLSYDDHGASLDRLVQGIALDRWTSSLADKLGDQKPRPGADVATDATSLVVTTDGKPLLEARGVSGAAFDVLGRPWAEILTLTGRHVVVMLDGERDGILLLWAGGGALVEWRCQGERLVCDEVSIVLPREGARID